jgi:hypothetical protein
VLERQVEEAYANGARDTALAFADLVDDCDRAIQALLDAVVDEAILRGIEGARARMLSHLEKQGLVSVFPLQQAFDPLFHEAIAVEPSDRADGTVVRVHRRGWLFGEKLIRPAIVTVCQGATVLVDEQVPEDARVDDPTDQLTLAVSEPSSDAASRPRRRKGGGEPIPGFIGDEA